MGFNCGIIGLPNVGKSTIFNALSGAGAQIANYPFCTIQPNRGVVVVPDERLKGISKLLNKEKPIPTRIEFIDVAGLVKGASKGEGLGNQFLGNIRNVDAIAHVVRCFQSQDVVHVTGDVDPISDIEVINTELILSDIEILDRVKEKLVRVFRSGEKGVKIKVDILDSFISHLNEGRPLNSLKISSDELEVIKEYGLITSKPVFYLANVDEHSEVENEVKRIQEFAERDGAEFLTIKGKLEEEISELPDDEKQDYIDALGIEEYGLDGLINAAYRLLNLITFYTSETSLQAWTIEEGTSALKAAGKIHTDFEKGFIRAEVFNYNDLIDAGSEHRIRETGLLRSEGRDYKVREGDIIRFLFNV